MSSAPLPLKATPIQFGTDGWRGVLGVDITVERLLPVAAQRPGNWPIAPPPSWTAAPW